MTFGRDERVHSLDGDVVQVLASLLDGGLCSSLVNKEHEGVVVFNRLDGALSAERVLDHGIFVPGGLLRHAFLQSEGLASERQGLWETEGNFGPNFRSFLGMSPFFHVFGDQKGTPATPD